MPKTKRARPGRGQRGQINNSQPIVHQPYKQIGLTALASAAGKLLAELVLRLLSHH